jgi:hypothetical protein
MDGTIGGYGAKNKLILQKKGSVTSSSVLNILKRV